MDSSNTFDVVIAGAGPAGSSVAIELALSGARVLLVEEKKFPRPKLCGEFISPECLAHFKRLGVMDQMSATGGAPVSGTIFYSRQGRSVAVPSEWFSSGGLALGLSRSEMDHQLLKRAKEVGVVVLEETHVASLLCEGERVCGVRVRQGDQAFAYRALVTVDATGRTRFLARHLDPPRQNRRKHIKPLVAFKAHLRNTQLADGACEIYFYQGGYGGLGRVEGGVTNLCFIVDGKDVRRYNSDPELVLSEVVMKNARAAHTLAGSQAVTPWLSVSLESFGRKTLAPATGLLAAGDAAAFIDPFTGSGMLLAMESGQLAANSINRHLPRLRQGADFDSLASDYRTGYARRFDSRLRLSGLLRRAALVPHLDELAIFFFGLSSQLRRKLARATRQSAGREVRAPGG